IWSLQDRGAARCGWLVAGVLGTRARPEPRRGTQGPRSGGGRRRESAFFFFKQKTAYEVEAGYANDEAKAFGFYVHKGLFEEYASFGRSHGHDLAPFDTYHQVRGLRWPVVNGQETKWRFREGLDPYVKNGKGVEFYGFPDGKAR